MIRICMFISVAVNVILVVLLMTSPSAQPDPVMGDLLDSAAEQSCRQAKQLKEYDPSKNKNGTYVTEVDPLEPAKLPAAVITYKLFVRCSTRTK